jgi:protease-4
MDPNHPGAHPPPGPFPTPRPQPHGWPAPAPPPPPGYGPAFGYACAPPPPQTIHVRAHRGGFSRAVGFVIGLLLFGTIFLIGVATGVGSMLASPTVESILLEQEYRDGRGGEIAIIPVRGIIDDAQAAFVQTAADKILKERSARAVVLRVDSPGGGVTPSDQIWRQIRRLKEARLPVVASFGALAASGGYYISCDADHIVAEETSITGSIGVIAQTFVVSDLLGKVGVEPQTLLASGSPNKDVGNPFRQWTEADRARIVIHLDAAYEIFVDRVREGRAAHLNDSQRVRTVADGSIFTAGSALERGLVDSVGYLDDAIAEAERRARIAQGQARVVVLRQPPSLFGPGMLLRSPAPPAGLDGEALRRLLHDLGAVRVMYLMP